MPHAATSLKLPHDLKARIERLARRSGASVHAFMVQALAEQVEATERHQAFLDDAAKADTAMQKAGTGFAMQDVHAYLAKKARGRKPVRPKPVKWRG